MESFVDDFIVFHKDGKEGYITNEGEESKKLIQEQMDGIAEVEHSISMPKGIYNISGSRQNELRKGINIIVNADGNVRKVLVK